MTMNSPPTILPGQNQIEGFTRDYSNWYGLGLSKRAPQIVLNK